MPETIPFREKAIFAFQRLPDNKEVCLFGMQTQEYTGDSSDPNSRRIYMDSLKYFNPSEYMTEFYRNMIIYYFDYCGNQEFTFAHIWACPPAKGKDYMFHKHPPPRSEGTEVRTTSKMVSLSCSSFCLRVDYL